MAYAGALDLAYIRQIIDAQLPESQELEYKRDLPKRDQQQAQTRVDPMDEFAKDVAAMANAAGGVLVYGLGEDPKTHKPVLHPIMDEDYDQASRRLHAVLDSYVEPRLFVQFEEIQVSGGYVLAIRIPASLAGPHWYGEPKKAGKRRFSVRRGASVSDYTYSELRAAFDRNASATMRARDWMADRVAAIKAGRTWQPLTHGPIAILHLVPMASYYQEAGAVDLQRAVQLTEKMPRPWQHGFTHNINFDGLIIYPGQVTSGSADVALFGYTQLFRNGTIEVVMFTRATMIQNMFVTPAKVGDTVHDGIVQGASVINELGKEGPILVGVTLINTRGYAMPPPDRFTDNPHMADRDDLVVPAAYLENSGDPVELKRTARTALDMLWQGFGFWSCPLYDQLGEYNRNYFS